MIACSCHAVSDRAIRAAAAAGLSAEEIARSTGAGTDCGCCADLLRSLVEEQRAPGCRRACPACPERRAA